MDRVRKGQKVKASTINTIFEAFDLQPDPLGGKGPSKGMPAILCLAENLGASQLEPFQVAIISGQSQPNNPQKQANIVLQIAAPDAGDDLTHLCVVQDIIPSGRVGRVIIMGLCWVETDLTEGAFASPAEGQSTVTLSDSGPAEVLWGSGAQYALIRFPVGGGGGAGNGDVVGVIWSS